MKYAFVFGKNWRLSLVEILAYLDNENVKYELIDLTWDCTVIEAEGIKPGKVIDDLGGTLKIIQISREFEWGDFSKQDFSECSTEALSFYGSKKCMRQLKEVFKEVPRERNFSHTFLIRKRVQENALIVGLKSCYFGETVAISNPFFYKERDERRPVTNYLTISPSRARILVNLSRAKSTLLDPFCGIGTIGQEAILRNIKTVYCSDISKKAADLTKQNLSWTRKHYKKQSVVIVKQCDARKLEECFSKVQSIATEPDLGPTLQHRIKRNDAVKIIKYLAEIYEKFFKSAYKVTKEGSIVAVVLPCILSRGGKIFTPKQYPGFELIDLFEKVPQKYRDHLNACNSTVLDEEREKGKSRITIREFCVYKRK